VWERVVEEVGEQRTKAIRCGACYYSIVLNAHRVTSMGDTDVDAVRKQRKTHTWSGTSIIKDGRYTFSYLGQYILLNIFLLKISRACSFFVIVHVSSPYATIGLISECRSQIPKLIVISWTAVGTKCADVRATDTSVYEVLNHRYINLKKKSVSYFQILSTGRTWSRSRPENPHF
jgi:hypothetical protein